MAFDWSGFFDRVCKALGTSSVEEIAAKLGLSVQSVYLWRKGKPPSIDTLMLISDLSGVSIHWMASGDGPMLITDEPKPSPALIEGPFRYGVRLQAIEDIEKSDAANDITKLASVAQTLKNMGDTPAAREIERLLGREVARLLLLGLDAPKLDNLRKHETKDVKLR